MSDKPVQIAAGTPSCECDPFRDERGQPYTLNGLQYLLDHSAITDRDAFTPTEADLRDPIFDALWSVMRLQEVLLPGNLRSGATGNDVLIVLRPLRERLAGMPLPAPPGATTEPSTALQSIHACLKSFIASGDNDPDARIGDAFQRLCDLLGLPWEPTFDTEHKQCVFCEDVIANADVQYVLNRAVCRECHADLFIAPPGAEEPARYKDSQGQIYTVHLCHQCEKPAYVGMACLQCGKADHGEAR